jgi:hypothetical protein
LIALVSGALIATPSEASAQGREAPIGFELWGNGRWSIGPVSGLSVRSGLALRAAGPHVPIAPPTPTSTGLCLDLSLTVQRYFKS